MWAAPSTTDGRSPAVSGGARGRVLVVDDNRALAELFRILAAQPG